MNCNLIISTSQSFKMIPLANKETQIKFNYLNQQDQPTASKIHQFKKEVFYNHQAIRENQLNKYVVETFSSLNLQTRKSIPSQLNHKPHHNRISNKKQNLLQMPETCQSLLKVEEYNSELQAQTQHQQSPTNNKQPKFKIDDICEIRQSEFQETTNRNQQPRSNKNKKVIKNNFNFQSIQDVSKSLFESTESTRNYNLKLSDQQKITTNINHGKRGSRQIKAFKIQNIEEKKESDFGGCCGFGIANKISFLSRDD